MRVLGLYNYQIFIFLMMVGFFTIIARPNLVKKLLGLNVFQTSVFIFYISIGKITGGTAPILMDMGHGDEGGEHGEEAAAGEGLAEGADAALDGAGEAASEVLDTGAHAADATTQAAAHAVEAAGEILYSNPLPHVLILTAIVVGIATTALGLSLVVRIREAYGTIEEDEIIAIENTAVVDTGEAA